MVFKRIIFCALLVLLSFSRGEGRAVQLQEKTVVELLAKHYPTIKEVSSLKSLLNKHLLVLSPQDSISTKVIANVFIANKTAEVRDALNRTSSTLFGEALQEVKKLDRPDLELWVATQYGFYLYTYRKYEETFPLFMSCINLLDQIEANKIISPCETYKKLAYFLMTAGDYEKANEYLLKARKYAEPNSSELAAITDNLGANSINRKKIAEAELYFKEALLTATASKDELRYGKALGNIAKIRFEEKNYDTAIELLQRDIAISKKVGNNQNTIYALVMLGKVYLAKENTAAANEALRSAQAYAQSKTYLQSSDYEINSLILEIAQQTGNDRDELMARRRLEQLKKTLAHLDGKDVITKVGWAMEKKNLQLTIEAEKAKREKETLIKIIALIGCCILAVAIVLVVRGFNKKIEEEKNDYDEKLNRLSMDKESSEQKLRANHQTLQSYKTYLGEKNDQIKELEIEMAKIKESSTAYSEKYKDKIEALLQSHLLDNDAWSEFKSTFIQLHPEYYQNLILNFKDLTDSNLRVIFLLKLEMNNTEIARMLGLTLEAVKKAKQRLKVKYGEDYKNLLN